ncbi:MAG: hypothetical protein JWM04_2755, partial [Verrucomicrobiales bacterium]|nr:hypothetical protein [Verrucomicrobiales bacterium]
IPQELRVTNREAAAFQALAEQGQVTMGADMGVANMAPFPPTPPAIPINNRLVVCQLNRYPRFHDRVSG